MIVINDEINWPDKCPFKEKKINPPSIEEPYYYFCTFMKKECQINKEKTKCLYLERIN